MVKFENRVALTKINHLIKTTPLIIFVELLSNAKQSKKSFPVENIKKYKKENRANTKSIILKEICSLFHAQSEQQKMKNCLTSGTTFGDKNKESKKNFSFKQLKNNYLKKNLVEQSALLLSTEPAFFSADVIASKHAISLSQGNNLVLFLDNNSLFLLENLEQNENILILGGIYRKRVLNHSQIARLIKLSKNNQIYHNINFFLKEKSFFGKTLLNGTPLHFFSSFSKNIYTKLCFTISSTIKKF